MTGEGNAVVASAKNRICPGCEARTAERTCAACKLSTIPLAALRKEVDPLLGQNLAGQYRIERVLGRGGMGTVYAGSQLSIKRAVAIKVISREYSSDLPSIKRFQREARITSRLTHPNTIRLYDFGLNEDGLLYLVMELLEGRELADELKESGKLTLARAVEVCVQVLRALEQAHELGIVHRDLKPANIFMQRMGGGDVPKVMDFGIAKTITGADLTKVTKTGVVIGTPAYMSPEQARGEAIGPAADIYAVGTIFYELLSGRVPFESDTAVTTLLMQLTQQAPPIAKFAPELPHINAVQGALNQMLAKRSDQRPQSARAAADLLTDLLHGGGATVEGLEDDTATVMFDVVTGNNVGPWARGGAGSHTAGRAAAAAPVEASSMAQPDALSATVAVAKPVRDTAESAAPVASGGKGALLAMVGLIALLGLVASGAAWVSLGGRGEEQPAAAAAGRSSPDKASAVGHSRSRPQADGAERAPAGARPEAAASPDLSARPAAIPAARLRVRIVSTPAGASVFAGGRPLGMTPLELDSPVKGSQLALELTAKGFEPASLLVPGGKEGELQVDLKRSPPQPELAPAQPRLPAARAKAPATRPKSTTKRPKPTAARPKSEPRSAPPAAKKPARAEPFMLE